MNWQQLSSLVPHLLLLVIVRKGQHCSFNFFMLQSVCPLNLFELLMHGTPVRSYDWPTKSPICLPNVHRGVHSCTRRCRNPHMPFFSSFCSMVAPLLRPTYQNFRRGMWTQLPLYALTLFLDPTLKLHLRSTT
jgi:hypothetical protein